MGPLLKEIGDLLMQDMRYFMSSLPQSLLASKAFKNPRSRRPEESLEQEKCTLGGRGSGLGALKQTRHTHRESCDYPALRREGSAGSYRCIKKSEWKVQRGQRQALFSGNKWQWAQPETQEAPIIY